MKSTDNYGIRYPESTDVVSAFPAAVAQENAEFLDEKLHELSSTKANTVHAHTVADVQGLAGELAGKAPASHLHNQSQIIGLGDALDERAAKIHSHSQSDVQGLDSALAGKASTTALNAKADRIHTHSQSDIQGLGTALNAKLDASAPSVSASTGLVVKRESNSANIRVPVTPESTIHATSKQYVDLRVPTDLAIRRDSTVGERVFAGGTMIYGDTGWRHMDLQMTENFTLWATVGIPPAPNANTFVRLNRSGRDVTLDARLAVSATLNGQYRSSAILLLNSIPAGFRPHAPFILGGDWWDYSSGETGLVRLTSGGVELQKGSGQWKTGDLTIIHCSWKTSDAWPSTLPGTTV